MSPDRFDELAKHLATRKLSRRHILRLLILTAVGGLFPFLRDSANSQGPTSPTPSKIVYLPLVSRPCNSGLTNCNGTCVDLLTDVNNCATCGYVCSNNHATPSCVNGTCNEFCDSGYADCDGDPTNGCETPLNTISNCGSCGHACSTNHCTSTCIAGNCAIASCDAGYVDCDGNPDDGCECEGTACCGSGCQTKHSNGVGQNYFDCNALGTPGNPSTYNSTMAMEAANSATGLSGSVFSSTCSGANIVCKQSGSTCACWAYSTTTAGYVRVNLSTNICYCPTPSDSIWN